MTNRTVSTALVGATSLEQLETNLAASSWRLTDEEMRGIEEAAASY